MYILDSFANSYFVSLSEISFSISHSQAIMEEQKFLERKLNDQILVGQEEALRHKEESIQQLKQQQKLLLGEKELVRLTLEGRRQVELDLEKARNEIFMFQKVRGREV
jgi:hypothetical protein